MKWGQYVPVIDRLKCGKITGASRSFAYDALEKRIRKSIRSNNDISRIVALQQAYCDRAWEANRRPYFNVWPGIERALLRVDLSKIASVLPRLPVNPLVFRLACGSELGAIESAMCFDFVADDGERVVLINGYGNGHNATAACGLSALAEQHWDENEPALAKMYRVDLAATMYVGLCLLANNPDMIEPDILPEDEIAYAEAKANKNLDVMQGIENRARSRGRTGFNIGRHVENCPHLRRPHFGIRYKGKGDPKPMLVPIKGAVVNRKKLTEVPTGYLDEAEGGAQ